MGGAPGRPGAPFFVWDESLIAFGGVTKVVNEPLNEGWSVINLC